MGVGAVMFCPLLVGPSAMVECVDDGLDMPVLAHPALAGCGRITPARAGELVTCYGNDVMLLIGGALLVAENPDAAMRQFATAVRTAGGRA